MGCTGQGSGAYGMREVPAHEDMTGTYDIRTEEENRTGALDRRNGQEHTRRVYCCLITADFLLFIVDHPAGLGLHIQSRPFFF